MSTGGQGTKWRRHIPENFNRLSRAHERYRRQTDGRSHVVDCGTGNLQNANTPRDILRNERGSRSLITTGSAIAGGLRDVSRSPSF